MVNINGANIELVRRGKGRPILFLHPHIGLHGSDAFIAQLSEYGEVIVPSHPGYGHSDLPAGMSTVDDMSYLYLDLLDALDLRDVIVVGASLGGWLAAEMAAMCPQQFTRLVLVGAMGVRPPVGEIFDMFLVVSRNYLAASFAAASSISVRSIPAHVNPRSRMDFSSLVRERYAANHCPARRIRPSNSALRPGMV